MLNMDLAVNYGWMGLNMKEIGKMDRQMELEYLHIPTLMFIMASFKEIEPTGMEFIFIKTVRDMKVNGKMMFKKDREKKFWKMDLYMKDSSKLERNGE